MLRSILLAVALAPTAWAAEESPRLARRTWFGTILDIDLRAAAPPEGFVTDPAAFAKLWKAWKPADLVPDVDFAKRFVLVQTHGSRKIDSLTLTLSAKGNLKVTVGFSAHKDFPGFTFGMAEVSRVGVRGVEGKELK